MGSVMMGTVKVTEALRAAKVGSPTRGVLSPEAGIVETPGRVDVEVIAPATTAIRGLENAATGRTAETARGRSLRGTADATTDVMIAEMIATDVAAASGRVGPDVIPMTVDVMTAGMAGPTTVPDGVMTGRGVTSAAMTAVGAMTGEVPGSTVTGIDAGGLGVTRDAPVSVGMIGAGASMGRTAPAVHTVIEAPMTVAGMTGAAIAVVALTAMTAAVVSTGMTDVSATTVGPATTVTVNVGASNGMTGGPGLTGMIDVDLMWRRRNGFPGRVLHQPWMSRRPPIWMRGPSHRISMRN